MKSLREMLKIPYSRLDDINAVLLDSRYTSGE